MSRQGQPVRLLVLLLLVLSTWSCTRSSTSTSTTAPSASRCPVSVTSSLETVPASGGEGTLQVATDRDCTWSVASQASWVTVVSGTGGQGSGTSSFRVAANTDPVTRRASLTVNQQSVVLSQDAACRYTVTPATVDVAAGATATVLRVEAGSGCRWTATSDAEWVRAAGSGAGAGTITLDVAANPGPSRTARVTVAGQTVTVRQAAVTVEPCTYAIDPPGQSLSAAGGALDVAVATGPACSWTASSTTSWITIARNPAGTGPSTVTLTVAPNPGASRSGTVTIAGSSFSVLQSAATACEYRLSASGTSVTAQGGTSSVTVMTAGTCSWSARTEAAWMSISGAASGSGNGQVGFVVSANTGPARSGTLTIAGLTYTVTQEAAPACDYAVRPAVRTVDFEAASGSFDVLTGPGCAWTAVIAPAATGWFTITGGSSGSGNATVAYRVSKNSGETRTVVVQVATGTFTLTQTAR